MKKAIPILVLLIGVGGYVYFFHILPSRQFDPTVRGSGTIEVTEAEVATKVPGRVTKIHVSEGQKVKRGQLLAELDCTDLALRLEQARARVLQAEASVGQAKAGRRQTQAATRQARSSVRPLSVNKEHAQREYERALKLSSIDGVPRKVVDDAQSAIRTLEERIAAATDGVQLAKTAVRTADKGIELAMIQVEMARIEVKLIQVGLDECSLRSPLDGYVVRRNYEPGEMVLPGASVLKVADGQDAYTWIYVSNKEVGQVRLGAVVELKADTYPDRVFEGTVVRISDRAEFTPKSVQTKEDRTRLVFGVKVAVKNDDRALLAGMPLEAKLTERTTVK